MSEIQKSAFYNGISFVDIDGIQELPTDFETDRIPNKGDILCFSSLIGNTNTIYHCEVLYIYDKRIGLIIDPELGDKTWRYIFNIINNER